MDQARDIMFYLFKEIFKNANMYEDGIFNVTIAALIVKLTVGKQVT